MSSDIYQRLSDDPRSMRLVRLASSNNFGHISITAQLVETTWDQSAYEALSYCWGKPDRSKTILLNGEQFQVTSDLHDALQQFCLADSSRALWIDAICINQQDSEEKGIQVQRMQDIYRNAERVLVWIGQAEDHTELAFKQVERLLACHDADAQKAIWTEPGEWVACLNEMIQRPYWSRAWTVQEVVLARAALLCCGPHTTPFFDFGRLMIQKMTRHQVRVNYALSSYLEQAFHMRQPSYEDPPMGLFGLAYKLRHRQCTVSHDRLYAFLGLLKSTDGLPAEEFPVDYTMDVDELWMTFAKATMSRYKTLLPLILAEDSRSVNARWCYDWSVKAKEPNDIMHERRLFWTGGLDNLDFYPLQSPRHSAADGLPARVRVHLEAPSVISAQGFTISKIVKTGTSVNSLFISFGRPNYVELFTEWEALVGGPWKKNPDMTRRFAHTVTGGAWDTEPADWRAWNTKNHSEKVWNPHWWVSRGAFNFRPSTSGYDMYRHSELPEDGVPDEYNRVRDDACEERRMFLLENGDFGLGPEGARVGDQVVVLLGSEVPLVLHRRDHGTALRRMADVENKKRLYGFTWKLVGQAYVHNKMQYSGDLEGDINSGKVVLEDYLLD